MFASESLLKFGYNAVSEANRLNRLPPEERFAYLLQEHSSYINHLAQDEAVSILYSYYLDHFDDVFISPSCSKETNVKYQTDFHERNGLFYEGLLLASQKAKENPNNLVILYSPTGKKLFEDTPTDNVEPPMLEFLKKPYTDGQLYFLFYDGKKINNVAVSVNGDKNPWLSEISDQFDGLSRIEDEEKRIHSYLTTPILVDDLENFFQKTWSNNHFIYTNKRKKNYFLDDILDEMRQTFAGKKKLPVNAYDVTRLSLQAQEITASMIDRGYRLILANFMHQNNLSTIELGGGCSGGSITKDELYEKSPIEIVPSFSSNFRYLRQGQSLLSKDNEESDEYGSLEFTCPHTECKKINKRPPHILLEKCQHCGKDVKCI